MLFPIEMRTIIARINALRAKPPCRPIMFELCELPLRETGRNFALTKRPAALETSAKAS
jgi:hypothetical protein